MDIIKSLTKIRHFEWLRNVAIGMPETMTFFHNIEFKQKVHGTVKLQQKILKKITSGKVTYLQFFPHSLGYFVALHLNGQYCFCA